jgi:hypothetical protein
VSVLFPFEELICKNEIPKIINTIAMRKTKKIIFQVCFVLEIQLSEFMNLITTNYLIA